MKQRAILFLELRPHKQKKIYHSLQTSSAEDVLSWKYFILYVEYYGTQQTKKAQTRYNASWKLEV